ncbi:MAG: FMN-binding protein [Lachnospiraceae bacterium]|jgi:Predicted NADH:ubiquinone oxidoreductase, subunit RnfG|uniref:FMN-binding protein n=1 Tax=Candidatus Merdisoma sp. JLR.KK011 TaxID=3114299 RepID=UPI0014351FFA|nr:FMN-binding protein [Lachnospiraceae bacterium]MCI9252814.1 FMN-binding protein [Lachnospiraceae bacterium]MCI9478452.1 FMN-binding protein [Lachnospiraceae bacterium]MCI9622059.1 FMN-binding protein [Lachnospiraceae bacterium]GFI09464.1 electron transport complex subunit RsxG [Lachnospiraceae bacterium]
MDKIKDALTLTLITLAAGILLGGVYELTKELIVQRQIEANAKAYQMVLPEAAEFRADESLSGKVAVSDNLLKQSGLSMEQVTIDGALFGYDESGAFAGLIVEATSKDGYGGAIKLAVGIREEGSAKVISGIDFLEINETAGLGMKAVEPAFKEQFANKQADHFELTKDGALEEYQIDALSGATRTSNAVTNAVNGALYFARESALKQ